MCTMNTKISICVAALAIVVCHGYPLRYNNEDQQLINNMKMTNNDTLKMNDKMVKMLQESKPYVLGRQYRLNVQDLSNEDKNLRDLKILASREDLSINKEMKKAPISVEMPYKTNGPKYQFGQEKRYNKKASRKMNKHIDSEENNSQEMRNRIYKD